MPTSLLAPPLANPPPWMTGTPTTASGGTAQTPTVQAPIVLPNLTSISGVVDMRFSMQDLSASQASFQMYRPVSDASSTIGAQIAVPLISRGMVAGISAASPDSITGGSAQFTVFLNDTSGPSMTWGTGTSETQVLPANLYPFDAGDEIDVRVSTTSSFAPTCHVEVIVYIIYAAET